MDDHNRRTIAELEQIAFSRQVKLPFANTTRVHVNRRRAAYIAALRKSATKSGPFRFLDLSPELRNMVYEELLVLQDSFTCHPQILSACKQIRGEASGILYGDNLIEVRFHHDGVYVHGQKVGDLNDFSAIRWPDMLRRAQRMHICFAEEGPAAACADGTNRYLHKTKLRAHVAERVFHSLCVFLAEGNSLHHTSIDLSYKDPRDGRYYENDIDLWPYRLLGPTRPRLIIENEPKGGLRHNPDDDPLLLSTFEAQRKTIKASQGLYQAARMAHHAHPNGFHRENLNAFIQVFVRRGLSSAGAGHLPELQVTQTVEGIANYSTIFRSMSDYVDFDQCPHSRNVGRALETLLRCSIDRQVQELTSR